MPTFVKLIICIKGVFDRNNAFGYRPFIISGTASLKYMILFTFYRIHFTGDVFAKNI